MAYKHTLVGFFIRDVWDFYPTVADPSIKDIWVIVDLAETTQPTGILHNYIATNGKEYVKVDELYMDRERYRAKLNYRVAKALRPIIDKFINDIEVDIR